MNLLNNSSPDSLLHQIIAPVRLSKYFYLFLLFCMSLQARWISRYTAEHVLDVTELIARVVGTLLLGTIVWFALAKLYVLLKVLVNRLSRLAESIPKQNNYLPVFLLGCVGLQIRWILRLGQSNQISNLEAFSRIIATAIIATVLWNFIIRIKNLAPQGVFNYISSTFSFLQVTLARNDQFKHFLVFTGAALLIYELYYFPSVSAQIITHDTANFFPNFRESWQHLYQHGTFQLFSPPTASSQEFEISYFYYFFGDTNGKSPLAMLMAGWYYLGHILKFEEVDFIHGYIVYFSFLFPLALFVCGYYLACALFKQWEVRIFLGLCLLFSPPIKINFTDIGTSEPAIWMMALLAAVINWVEKPSWKTLLLVGSFGYIVIVSFGQAYLFVVFLTPIFAVIFLLLFPSYRKKFYSAIQTLDSLQWVFMLLVLLLSIQPNLILLMDKVNHITPRIPEKGIELSDHFNFLNSNLLYTDGNPFYILLSSFPGTHGLAYIGLLGAPLLIFALLDPKKGQRTLFIILSLIVLLDLYSFKRSVILYLLSGLAPEMLLNRHYGDLLFSTGGILPLIFLSGFGLQMLLSKTWNRTFFILMGAYLGAMLLITWPVNVWGRGEVSFGFLLFAAELALFAVYLNKGNVPKKTLWTVLLLLVLVDLTSTSYNFMKQISHKKLEPREKLLVIDSGYRNRLVVHKSVLALRGTEYSKMPLATFYSDAVLVPNGEIRYLDNMKGNKPKIPIINKKMVVSNNQLFIKKPLSVAIGDNNLSANFVAPSSGYVVFRTPDVRWETSVNSLSTTTFKTTLGFAIIPVEKGQNSVLISYHAGGISKVLVIGYLIVAGILIGMIIQFGQARGNRKLPES